MAVDLSQQLLELQKSTEELNAATDKANDVVRRTEIFLKEKCRVGGSASVDVPSLAEEMDPPNGPDLETCLAYERYKSDYRIVVIRFLDGDPHDTKPWAECSRDIKLETLKALPNLIEKLLKQVKEQVADVRATVDFLDSTIPPAIGLRRGPSTPKKG